MDVPHRPGSRSCGHEPHLVVVGVEEGDGSEPSLDGLHALILRSDGGMVYIVRGISRGSHVSKGCARHRAKAFELSFREKIAVQNLLFIKLLFILPFTATKNKHCNKKVCLIS